MIQLGEERSTCKAQHEFYINAAVFLEKRHSGCPLSAEEIHPQIRNFRVGFKIHARSTTIREQ